ncbi:MAG: family 20 glycosylhydrolase [Armatimonadetes bacterium]|nr:family 20 glycosylhydrolase [Armatimonadota bacterium]
MLGILAALWTQNPGVLPLVPLPTSVKSVASKPFLFDKWTVVTTDKKMFAVSELRSLVPQFKLAYSAGNAKNVVTFQHDAKLGNEAYTLHVDFDHILVRYSKPAGALYAIETLKQLRQGTSNQFASVDIQDSPRFKWRGMHLDVSRHFFPVTVIKRTLDLMKAVKMNVFHWHLVDDGGWRLEIKKYPKLTEIGAWRKGTGVPWSYSDINLAKPVPGEESYGGFYTQAQVRDVVKYAADRGITVVPEIEMPGHTLPVLVAYPELGCTGATKYPGNSWTTNVYCAGKDATFQFIDNVLDEVMKLFPSPWIHIGGDEVDKKWWNACPDCQARMKAENLKDAGELQSYFIKRVEQYINSKGRKMIGWDEILEGGLAPNATVMSWRGIDGGIAAAKSGHEVVMSPTSHCYFDYSYDAISTEHVYNWEPVPPSLVGKERNYVIGGQCNVWTEWIPTVERYDRMVWPRAFATAEVLWSSAPKDWDNFQTRLLPNVRNLDSMGVAYYLEAPSIPCAFSFDTKPMTIYRSDFNQPVFGSGAANAQARDWKLVLAQQLPMDTPFYLAYKRGDGTLGDAAALYQSSKVYPLPSVMPANGLSVEVIKGKYSSVDEFEHAPPQAAVPVTDVDLAKKPSGDQPFALRFKARIHFPDRKFRLYVTSDDGSVVKLNGVRVVDNDGLHGAVPRSSGIQAADGFYNLEVLFFDAGGASSLKLEYESDTVKREAIPTSWYYQPGS